MAFMSLSVHPGFCAADRRTFNRHGIIFSFRLFVDLLQALFRLCGNRRTIAKGIRHGRTETAFRDTDYEIPAAYTKGKDRVTIKLKHVAGQADDSSNEYYYWVYSYGRTPIPAER